jgi:lipopolysaccharide biosynthesis glycosyltransferase
MRGLVFSVDNAYVIPLKVLWYSLIKTQSIPNGTPIFILHDDTLSHSAIKDLTDFIGKNNFDVLFLDVSLQVPANLPSFQHYVSRVALYRLYAASVLPEELDSVVYLDVDMLAVRSVKHLFEVELTHPIAAVDHMSPSEQLLLWGDLSGNYFNSGVLIFDLDTWRKNECEKIFTKILLDHTARLTWLDQCTLNLTFQNNWQRLPIWFNVGPHVARAVGAVNPNLLEHNSCLLHFIGGAKPWKYNVTGPYETQWYKVYMECFGRAFDLNVNLPESPTH